MSSTLAARSGAQRPQFEHRPGNVVSSAGREAVDLAGKAGILLDDWQAHVLEVGCGERGDGTWAALEVAVIVPRQNGKNEILAARELAGVVLFKDDLITHSAHRADTTLEQFRKLEQLADDYPDFGRLVMRVSRVNGHESIELRGGRRIRFVSRQRNPGRGFSGSVVVLDEAFDLDPAAIGAMIPTLSTREMAQVWYASSPPHADSVVLHGVRRRGRQREGKRLAYFEWCNPADVDPADRDAQYAANPALGVRISEDFIDAERELMRDIPGEFLREVMGVAEEPVGADAVLVPNWDELVDRGSVIVSHHQIALDVSPDRRFSSFGGAGRRADGRLHVEAWQTRPGTSWVLEVAAASWEKLRIPVRIQTGSPASSFIAPLREIGVDVVEMSPAQHAQALGQFLDACVNDQLRHLGAATLTAAVKGATVRHSGDVDVWARRGGRVDISSLVAVTLALGGVPAPTRRSAYEDSGLEVIG